MRQSVSSLATQRKALLRASRLVRWSPRESMPRTQRTTTEVLAAARRTSGYSSSRLASSCCLESFSRASERRAESGSRSRAKRTAAATSGPARQTPPASSAPAMKRRSNERSKAKSFRPFGFFLERADALRRPVGEEGMTDDPLLGDRPPVAAIVALPTVVAHHKKVARRNRDGLRQIAQVVASRALVDVGLVQRLAVDVRVVVADVELVARKADHALDEVAVGALVGRLRAGVAVLGLARDAALVRIGARRRLEDDDVPARGVAEVGPDPVDQDALTDFERGDHRRARDAERLHEEGLDPDRETQRHRDDHHELDERVGGALLALLLYARHRRTRRRRASGVVGLGLAVRGRLLVPGRPGLARVVGGGRFLGGNLIGRGLFGGVGLAGRRLVGGHLV